MGTMKQMRFAVACALAVMIVAPVRAQVQEFVLHDFTQSTGRFPTAGVTLAPDGIYGTAQDGGTLDHGVVYKLDTAFHYTVLHNFTGADGAVPWAGVIRDSAGNFYGTTYIGGTANKGVVYKLDSAGNLTVLYNFTGEADGGSPLAGVIRDSAGNLYGTTYIGGTADKGVVYKLDSAGDYTVLYNFTGGTAGGNPYAGVIRDSAGNLYGTTTSGTSPGDGVLYKLDEDGNYTVLHHFTANSYPNGVIFAPDGLYGTTRGSGTGHYGVVYKLGASAGYTVLYNFTGGEEDGGGPSGGVVRDSAGNLYGTTYIGGIGDYGVVYKVDSAGNYSVLYNFSGDADGGHPYAGVILSPAGNLIGTTDAGGTSGGVVFVVTGVQ
jgi:uncharacterized repeat protein (TIGR03803 family)